METTTFLLVTTRTRNKDITIPIRIANISQTAVNLLVELRCVE